MDYDTAFVLGLVVVVISIPAMIAAFADKRAPRAAALALLIGAGLFSWATLQKPGGYTLEQVPDVFLGVVARYVK